MQINIFISRSLFILSFLFMISCSNESKETKDVATLEEKTELSTKIDALYIKLSESMDAEEAKFVSQELLVNCTNFVETFPKDDKCAEYLFIAARAAIGLGKYDESLRILDTIRKGYKGYDKMPEVYFLYAFTLDEDLDRKKDAQKAYMDLINTFPGDHLSTQSALLLDQLYMSDEELIESWKQKEEDQ